MQAVTTITDEQLALWLGDKYNRRLKYGMFWKRKSFAELSISKKQAMFIGIAVVGVVVGFGALYYMANKRRK